MKYESYKNSSRPLVIGLLAAALFGASTPASKALLGPITPFQLAGLLYLGSAIGVMPLIASNRKLSMPWQLSHVNRTRLFGSVAFGGLLGPVLLLVGLRLASSASVALWLNLELVATVILGYLFFRDKLTSSSCLAAIFTIAAAVLLSASEGPAGIRAGMFVFLACFCWGMDNHLTALIDGIRPAETTFWKGMVGGVGNLAIGLVVTPLAPTLKVCALAITVGVFSYGLSIVLYITSAQQLGATRSQIVFSSSPFFGVLFSALLLGETISAFQAIAIALIAFSLVFLTLERHHHEHRHTELAHEHLHRHDGDHHEHKHQPGEAIREHSHWHEHKPMVHIHAHWPDLHHRHDHEK
jgi:drug/metabolite transporter (DMT)-like permease